jgi:outer membrane protein OmpA-like peptidoglycan-associated protein
MSTVMAPDNAALPDHLRQSPAANDPVTCPAAVVPVAKLPAAARNAELSMLDQHLRRLSAELDAAHIAGFGENLYLRSVAGLPRVVLTFADNSSAVRMDDRLLRALCAAVRSAKRIFLHGHTDAFAASQTGTELAIRRAVEVKRLLISLNVDPQRIRLLYRGAGNFVANNSTPEGKAMNRRVEIELRKR